MSDLLPKVEIFTKEEMATLNAAQQRFCKNISELTDNEYRKEMERLNHKDALKFVLDNPDYLSNLTIHRIEDIHSILTKELDVDKGLRHRRVGITRTALFWLYSCLRPNGLGRNWTFYYSVTGQTGRTG